MMVGNLREISLAMGDGTKEPSSGESETAKLVRRSWHSKRELKVGHRLDDGDIALKRPADGLPPANSPSGRTLALGVGAGAPIRAEDLV